MGAAGCDGRAGPGFEPTRRAKARGADGERAVPLRSGGKLGDIAPTLLDLWGLAKPGVMSGESLVEGVRG